MSGAINRSETLRVSSHRKPGLCQGVGLTTDDLQGVNRAELALKETQGHLKGLFSENPQSDVCWLKCN